ncbi:MAG: amidohydrolase family protein, partial [Anaerolineales bacterium]|nr:amidohydrolase family protein [Anaerolineales bacterium]
MKTWIIKSGTLITASETFQADIVIQGEKIVQIGLDLRDPGAEVIDARDKLVMPGGIDPHVHLALPMFGTISSDDHYTGHKAAAFGGTTTVMDFSPQDFSTLQEAVDAWHARADDLAAIDFGFHMNITRLDERVAAEIPRL